MEGIKKLGTGGKMTTARQKGGKGLVRLNMTTTFKNCWYGHMKDCCRHINTDESSLRTWKEILIDSRLEYAACMQ